MNQDLKTLAEEKSRDRTLAGEAAYCIAELWPLADIATEPLECLAEMIRQELQDRDLRRAPLNLAEKPF